MLLLPQFFLNLIDGGFQQRQKPGLALKGDLQRNLAVAGFSVCSCRLCALLALYEGHGKGFVWNSELYDVGLVLLECVNFCFKR